LVNLRGFVRAAPGRIVAHRCGRTGAASSGGRRPPCQQE
jgi:hypothetical protein